MSYLSRAWMAASVAVVQGHTDQGFKWNSGVKTLQQGRKRLSAAGFRPFSSFSDSDVGNFLSGGNGDERRQQADESLQKAMYLSCWGQS